MNIFKTWYFQRFVILKLSLTKTIELIALYKTNMLDKTIDTNLKEEWFWIAKKLNPKTFRNRLCCNLFKIGYTFILTTSKDHKPAVTEYSVVLWIKVNHSEVFFNVIATTITSAKIQLCDKALFKKLSKLKAFFPKCIAFGTIHRILKLLSKCVKFSIKLLHLHVVFFLLMCVTKVHHFFNRDTLKHT